MEREGPRFGRVYERAPIIEDHSFIPGQGPVEVQILRHFRPDGLISSIAVFRRNSLIPGSETIYTYDTKNGTAVLSYAKSYLSNDVNAFLVEVVTAQEGVEPKTEQLPNDPEIKKLLGVFVQPKPGESPDLTSALEKARKVKHPSIRFLKDGNEEALLTTGISTDITPGGGVIYLTASIIRFVKNGDKVQISSLVSRSLIGVSDESLEPATTGREFFYTNGVLTGRKQYVGDELIYTDKYVLKTLNVNGKNIGVYDCIRNYSEWGQRESGRKGEYREWYVNETGELKMRFREKFD